jgi:hypothetical protein
MLPGLPGDRRGFILVVASVMGVLLVGALWYIASVGDAIVFRERMQDAADATAFEDAVWHARGMNAVAMLNMVMAFILAVVVALRVLEAALLAYIAVTTTVCTASLILSLIPVADIVGAIGDATCGVLTDGLPAVRNALDKVRQLDDKLTPRIMNILAAITRSEEVVAAAAPVLATVQSSLENTQWYRGSPGTSIDGTLGVSLSLLPPVLDERFASLGTSGGSGSGGGGSNESGSGSGGGGASKESGADGAKGGGESGSEGGNGLVRMGTFFPDESGVPKNGTDSLPVSQDDFSVLCAQAAKTLPNGLQDLIDRTGQHALASHIGAIANVIGDIAGSIPTLACGESEGGGKSSGENTLQEHEDKATEVRCDSEKAAYDKAHTNDAGVVDPPYPSDKTAECEKKNKESAEEEKVSASERVKPAKVWPLAKNGSAFMQTWSVVISGDPPRQASDDRALVIADHGNDSHLVSGASGAGWTSLDAVDYGVAGAEYYFDCEGAWDGDCSDSAMWRLGWTARMRRVWLPTDFLSHELGSIGAAWVMQRVGDNLEKFTGDVGKEAGIKWLEEGAFWDSWLTQQLVEKNIESVVNPIGESVNSTGAWLMQHVGGKRRTIIH